VTIWVDLINAEVHRTGGPFPTRVLTAGEGPPVVLLHGQGGSLENFRHNIGPLAAAGFRVVALDLLWHGRSGTPPVDRRLIPVWTGQVLAVLADLGLARSHLIGQSLGGWVAATIALQHPDLVRSLVLTTPMGLDPGAPPGREALAPVLRAQLTALEELSPAAIRRRMSVLFGDPSQLDEEMVAVRQAIYSDPAVNRSLRDVASAYLGSGDTDPYRLGPDELGRLSVPTLLYWGTHNLGGPGAGAALAKALPASAEYHCADVGHWAQYEQPGEYNATVLGHLRRN
jgi:pimeloyl-ACP methyl ester carboxylesterase